MDRIYRIKIQVHTENTKYTEKYYNYYLCDLRASV
jgi:hypothetical protein